MLDSNLDKTFEDGDCVFGNELLERNKEGCLNRY